ncbi:glycosyltransferase [Amycolatopsis sp. NPDC005232]|uniref:glycosyltransferase n=1 Tax=Amycolatopsis sp. NPDC005232 TaxID=3157027 RepID=UPI0033B986C3
MRILFSATPAHGHIIPLLPLARSFRAQGDDVALLTAGSLASSFVGEGMVPLAAGPALDVLMGEVMRRTGADPLAGLTPEQEAEAFAGVRVDLTADEAEAMARGWQPDLIVSEHYDFVGPITASALGVPFATLAFGPAMSPTAAALMTSTIRKRHDKRGIPLRRPRWYLDTCPLALQTDGWSKPEGHIGLRPEPHRAAGRPPADKTLSSPKRSTTARVLVTFGTVFSSPEVLNPLLVELSAADLEVSVTTGLQASAGDYAFGAENVPDNVKLFGFTPLDELLPGMDIAVTHGGAGSTLGILAAGIPMVVVPLAADQFVQAARVANAGAGISVEKGASASDVAKAVASLLAEPAYRENAGKVAEEIAALVAPEAVAARLRQSLAEQ